MRSLRLMILVGMIPLAGCTSQDVFNPELQHGLRRSTVQMMYNISVDNGVIAQRTIYPHHFAVDAAELNDHGKRDLDVLASHFRKHAGQLSVRRGMASEGLHARRIDAVRHYLAFVGVEQSRITIGDGLPGGPALASEDVIHILDAERQSASGQAGMGMSGNLAGPSEGGSYGGATRR